MSAAAEISDVVEFPDETDRVDGRSLRRERNRDAVIAALLDLIREGNFEAGGAEIAERAGVSHRSVFRYFDDLGDLVRTAIDFQYAEAMPLGTIEALGEGSLARRVEVLVDTRLRMYERIDGVATVARSRALSIPEINDEFQRIVAIFRDLMYEHLAPELESFADDERECIVDAAMVMVSWDAFDLQRRLFNQSNDQIRRSWIVSLTALLSH